jgi:hypothetical protein
MVCANDGFVQNAEEAAGTCELLIPLFRPDLSTIER